MGNDEDRRKKIKENNREQEKRRGRGIKRNTGR